MTTTRTPARSPQVRYFGSGIGYTYDQGIWKGALSGFTFHLQKRPAGWFYVGPGAPDGEYAGWTAVDAAEWAAWRVEEARKARDGEVTA